MLAEVYSDSVFNWQPLTDLVGAGFDYVYHEFFYRLLKKVFQDHEPMEYLTGHLNFLNSLTINRQLTHYLANHDDPIIPEALRNNQVLTSLMLFLPGSGLIPNGQLNDFDHRLAHHTLEIVPQTKSELQRIPPWFKNLMQIKKALTPAYVSVEIINKGVLKVHLLINQHQAYLLSNLGENQYTLNEQSPGMLHNRSEKGQLNPGEAELFL